MNSDSVAAFDFKSLLLVLASLLALESVLAWAVESAEGDVGEDYLGDDHRRTGTIRLGGAAPCLPEKITQCPIA